MYPFRNAKFLVPPEMTQRQMTQLVYQGRELYWRLVVAVDLEAVSREVLVIESPLDDPYPPGAVVSGVDPVDLDGLLPQVPYALGHHRVVHIPVRCKDGSALGKWLSNGVLHVVDQSDRAEWPQNQKRPRPFFRVSPKSIRPVLGGRRMAQPWLLDLKKKRVVSPLERCPIQLLFEPRHLRYVESFDWYVLRRLTTNSAMASSTTTYRGILCGWNSA